MQPALQPDDEPSEAGPAKPGRNLPIAIATGVGLGGAVIGTLFWNRWAYTTLVAGAVVVALAELYRVLEEHRGLKPAHTVGYAGAVVILFGTAWRGPVALSFAFTAVALVTFLWYLADPERRDVNANIAATLLGVVYVPMFAAHVVAMPRLPHGPSITIVFFGLAVFYDVGAYAAGSLLGRHRMAPAISPGKTWEGAAGATLLVFVLALTVAPRFRGMSLPVAAGLAAIVVVLSPLGDLAESLLKRDLGIKDMGGLLPGHGGMLDRIDALLFCAPFAYWYLRALS